MISASDYEPIVGRPVRVTRYTSGSGLHTFLPAARWARVTLVGGGGNGGATGTWFDGDNATHYEAGGGGGGGEERCVEFDPQHIGTAAYAVGAAESPTRFHSVTAAAGARGLAGGYEGPSGGEGYRFEGGLGGGLQRFGANDNDAEKPTASMHSYSQPGASGGAATGSGGDGGRSTYGDGGAGGVYVGAAYPAPCNSGAAGTGYGAGGGGGSGAAQGSAGRTLGAGGTGTGGLIVVEEWVY